MYEFRQNVDACNSFWLGSALKINFHSLARMQNNLGKWWKLKKTQFKNASMCVNSGPACIPMSHPQHFSDFLFIFMSWETSRCLFLISSRCTPRIVVVWYVLFNKCVFCQESDASIWFGRKKKNACFSSASANKSHVQPVCGCLASVGDYRSYHWWEQGYRGEAMLQKAGICSSTPASVTRLIPQNISWELPTW